MITARTYPGYMNFVRDFPSSQILVYGLRTKSTDFSKLGIRYMEEIPKNKITMLNKNQ